MMYLNVLLHPLVDMKINCSLNMNSTHVNIPLNLIPEETPIYYEPSPF